MNLSTLTAPFVTKNRVRKQISTRDRYLNQKYEERSIINRYFK